MLSEMPIMERRSVPAQASLPEARLFQSNLEEFKARFKDLSKIEAPLNTLENVFVRDVRLNHPRDIYPIYEALTVITHEVAQIHLHEINQSWNVVLNSLNGRKILKIGLGETTFDTYLAQQILHLSLDAIQQTVAVSTVDLSIPANQSEIVDYILKADMEAFGSCFQRGFMKAIIQSEHVRCVVARVNNEIVGILWGFIDQTEDNRDLFHFWELSRKASLAHMGIARKLIAHARQMQRLYPNLEFATLNVDVDNRHAKSLYDGEQFASMNEDEQGIAKIFMANNLKGENANLDLESARAVVKKFVMKTVPLHKLLFFELLRRCELLWRYCWYR